MDCPMFGYVHLQLPMPFFFNQGTDNPGTSVQPAEDCTDVRILNLLNMPILACSLWRSAARCQIMHEL